MSPRVAGPMPKSKHRKPKHQAKPAAMPKTNGHVPFDPTVYKLGAAEPADYAKVDAPRKKIVISIPSYSGAIDYATHASLLRSSTAAYQRGWITDMAIRAQDSVLKRARDVMFTEFLDKFSDATDMLFIDHDISWTAEGFVRLMTHQVDIVGGAYRSRGDPEVYVLRTIGDELQRDPKTGLMEVEGLGTGYLRITRQAAQKIADNTPQHPVTDAMVAAANVAAHMNLSAAEVTEIYRAMEAARKGPGGWYTDPTAHGMHIRDIFDFAIRDHKLYSEDYLFCQHARSLGLKVWLDPEQDLGHSGAKIFAGNLMTYLQANAKRVPDSVPKGEAASHFAQQGPDLAASAKALMGDG